MAARARPLLVLDVVGLTPKLLAHAPRLRAIGPATPLTPPLPAVTCTSQATFLTGLPPSGHGVVGNGWYFRDLAEVLFWRQSNRLVDGEKLYETLRARDPSATSAKLFWWFNMYAAADLSVTPRPAYPADGRKLPDVYTEPPELRDELTARHGRFPLFRFWGPAADLVSSRWIADASIHVIRERRPTLALVYLPHLDYVLQREGPDGPSVPRHVADVDALAGALIDAARPLGYEVVALSEYGITAVTGAVALNQALRREGLLRVHASLSGELLDAGASRAFAVADHQLAHVYVRDPADRPAVARLLRALPGVAEVLEGDTRRAAGLDHPRSGELVAIAAPDRWFSYVYWLDEARAPDFARTVDIHRKPGYDPVELFLDPRRAFVKGAIAWRLLKKKLGFRTVMDLIPLDDSLVRGSHGRLPARADEGPVWLSSLPVESPAPIPETAVKELLLRLLFRD
jgi:predicted AlkP superfamily pyrophosphatase or phosphodiesterase